MKRLFAPTVTSATAIRSKNAKITPIRSQKIATPLRNATRPLAPALRMNAQMAPIPAAAQRFANVKVANGLTAARVRLISFAAPMIKNASIKNATRATSSAMVKSCTTARITSG